MWRTQVEGLSKRFRTVSYDLRGFGRSATPGSQPYKHCDDAASLCEYLELDEVVAIGHSVGAHQALEFALERPDLVAGWVGVCASALSGIAFPEALTQMFTAIRKAAGEQSIEAAKAIWRQAGWFASARAVSALVPEMEQMLASYSGWHFTHDNPVKSVEPPAAERLDQLCVPALVITGGLDLPYNGTVGDALLQGIDGATALKLPRVGHMANMEDPEAVNHAIAELAEIATFDE